MAGTVCYDQTVMDPLRCEPLCLVTNMDDELAVTARPSVPPSVPDAPRTVAVMSRIDRSALVEPRLCDGAALGAQVGSARSRA